MALRDYPLTNARARSDNAETRGYRETLPQKFTGPRFEAPGPVVATPALNLLVRPAGPGPLFCSEWTIRKRPRDAGSLPLGAVSSAASPEAAQACNATLSNFDRILVARAAVVPGHRDSSPLLLPWDSAVLRLDECENPLTSPAKSR